MSDTSTHVGTCFCGAVEIAVTGEPAVMGYCHCASCRAWSAGPVNAFTLWPPDAVKVTKGADNVASYQKPRRASQVVQDLRRPPLHRAPGVGRDRTSTRRRSPPSRSSRRCT